MTQKKSAGAADSAAPDWQPTVSGDATLELSAVPAGRSTALQMNFRFNRGGGFVVAKQVRMRSMPEEYTVRFRVRGRGAAIQLELKLADPSGRNVWRHVIKDLSPPARWKRMVIESRDIEFAWGPAGSGGISQLGSMEIAVVSSAAAQGTLWIADLQIEDSLAAEPPTASASSVQPGFDASRALAGPGWKPRADDLRPWIVVDMIQPRRLGGLVIDWLGAAPAGGFRLRGSNSGRRWNTLYVAATAGGAHSYLYLPGTSDFCVWSSPSPAAALPCICSRSNFPAPSTPFGTTWPAPSRAAGIRAGCTGSRPCGRRSARRTASSAH